MRYGVGEMLEARASRVGTPATGFSVAKANPLIVLTPILRPVKEPGPREMAHPSSVFDRAPCLFEDVFDGTEEPFGVSGRDVQEVFCNNRIAVNQSDAATGG